MLLSTQIDAIFAMFAQGIGVAYSDREAQPEPGGALHEEARPPLRSWFGALASICDPCAHSYEF